MISTTRYEKRPFRGPFVAQGLAERDREVPDEVLSLYPEDIRPYLRPRQAIARAERVDETGGNTARRQSV